MPMPAFIILAIVYLVALIAYGLTRWRLNRKFYLGCQHHLMRTIDNPGDIEAAKHELHEALMYCYNNGFTQGNTSLFIRDPLNDIQIWYNNVHAAFRKLNELDGDLTPFQRGMIFQTARRCIEELCYPERIAFYPKHYLMSAIFPTVLVVTPVAFAISFLISMT